MNFNKERQGFVVTDGQPLLEVSACVGATSMKFIVDTGAAVSIIPRKDTTGVYFKPSAVQLSSANGERIKVYGETTLPVNIQALKRSYDWTFIVAETTNALLGADFLRYHNLVVDCRNSRIIDNETEQSAHTYPISFSVNNALVINDMSMFNDEVRDLLIRYPSLTSPRNTELSEALKLLVKLRLFIV